MSNLAKALLLTGVFLLSACATNTAVRLSTTSAIERAAWDEACARTEYRCFMVNPPKVGTSEYVGILKAYGFYNGGNTVFLKKDLDITDTFGFAVLVHEMVHYLQARSDKFPYPGKLSSCMMEEEAWEVYNEVVVSQGRQDLFVKEWFKAYPGC